MKKIVVVVACLVLLLGNAGCGKSSGLGGKVVDGKGKPIAGLKIVASKMKPVKGYERFETVSGADGSFVFEKLFPSAKYVIKPLSDKWTTEASLAAETAPAGEVSKLTEALTIRFTLSKEGVITDSQTDLQWAIGPAQDTGWHAASDWVNGLTLAGDGWRMPSRTELKGLYQENLKAKYKIDALFNLNACCIWTGERAEQMGIPSACAFNFTSGAEGWDSIKATYGSPRAFAVRSPK